MKITIEFNLEPISIIDPNLLEEIIRHQFMLYLDDLLVSDANNFDSGNPELWIDVSDDGDGKYNTYQISIEKQKNTDSKKILIDMDQFGDPLSVNLIIDKANQFETLIEKAEFLYRNNIKYSIIET